ncbi:TPA: hypothetical protein N0F65_002767 [Lagenidium giganteum]|uniref:PI3K/PI4K catalytic domain-containing protein n=1 Tax=Lagenidium giganteum TaxID=4803 RepID=A0AAV2YMA1_9STRA|nr:TPA: hypothetical protein N0F65_002767 [Lagenidium giganteum]
MVKLAPTASCSTPRKLNLLVTQTARRSERFQHDTGKGNWRSAVWPSSPVLKKLTSTSPNSKTCSVGNNDDNNDVATVVPFLRSLKKRDQQPQDDCDLTDFGSDSKHSPTLFDLRNSEIKLSRAALRPQAKLVAGSDVVCSKADEVSSPEEPLSSVGALARSSLFQELSEFKATADAKILMLPDYLPDHEKELVKDVTEELRLGCQVGERNIAIFKLGTAEKMAPLHPHHRLARHREAMMDDLYVDVSELAQQGKDGFIARLRLRRLNSGSGMRHNMLWDVASSDGVAESVSEGEGGVYAVQSRSSGQKLAMFKPAEEERFVREGLFPGEGAVREEAAYELDARMNGFSGVPTTAVARLHLSNIGRTKQGAVQKFMIGSIGSMEGFGMPFDLKKAEEFVPVDQVHRIGLLDVRLFNTDRHPGNILLIGERAPYTMVPIDHGCILPSWFHLGEARFDWLEYPQSKVPFSSAAMQYIDALDADADAMALRRLGIREECVVTLKICTLFLQRAALAGKTLHWIGTFMQREGCFENPSRLESAVLSACQACGIPFTFVPNEYNEQKGSIPLGVLSRRPPNEFYRQLEQCLQEEIDR